MINRNINAALEAIESANRDLDRDIFRLQETVNNVTRRSADPVSPYYVHPDITAITSLHPTVVDIAERDAEITKYDAAVLLKKKMDKRRQVAYWLVYAIGGVAAILAPFYPTPAVILVGISVSLLVSIPQMTAPSPGIRPTKLTINPYNKWENATLLFRDDPTQFKAICGCPGCWTVDAHPIRTEHPPKIGVIRKCDTCQREWAQV